MARPHAGAGHQDGGEAHRLDEAAELVVAGHDVGVEHDGPGVDLAG